MNIEQGAGSTDSRTIAMGTNRWITDSRVYNLIWLGRWIERAQTIARVVRWAAQQDVGRRSAGTGNRSGHGGQHPRRQRRAG